MIEENILVRAVRAVVLEEVTQPVDWGSFGDTCVTMEAAGVVVCNQDPSCFTIEANKFCLALLVSRASPGEREINGETLVGTCRCFGSVGTSGMFCHLGLDANRAGIEDRVGTGEFGNTLDSLVGIVEAVVTWVPKALVPEKSLGLSFQGIDRGGLVC